MARPAQLSTSVSDATRQQADWLMAERGYSLRDIMTLGIARLYEREIIMKAPNIGSKVEILVAQGPEEMQNTLQVVTVAAVEEIRNLNDNNALQEYLIHGWLADGRSVTGSS